MDSFDDFLFLKQTPKDKEKKNKLESLKLIYNRQTHSKPYSTAKLSQLEECKTDTLSFGAYLSSADDARTVSIHQKAIRFLMIKDNNLDIKLIQNIISNTSKPVVILLKEFLETRIIELSLAGASTVCFPLQENWDKAAIQFSLEFGRDFNVESVISVSKPEDLKSIQRVDCPMVMVPPTLLTYCKQDLANTRSVLLLIDDLSDVDCLQVIPHHKWVAINYNRIVNCSIGEKDA